MRTARKLIAVTLLLTAPWSVVHAQEPSSAQLQQMQEFMKIMQGYYALVNAVHEVASDKDKAAIFQLQKIQEIYKQRGDRAEAVKVLSEVVKTTSSDTVRNAASLMLADTLNETGRASQAVEVLEDALARNLE